MTSSIPVALYNAIDMHSPPGPTRGGSFDAFPRPRLIRGRCSIVLPVPKIRIKDAAAYLSVSDDTVRRWIDAGLLTAETDASNRKVVDGYQLATFAKSHANPMADPSQVVRSARNRFVGLVTDIVTDKVMAQVELQCGPFRVVSLMSSEAVRELGLELGAVAVAVVKSTTVIIETPQGEA